MDAPRFDRWTGSLTGAASRRSVLGLVGAALGLPATQFPGITAANKKPKKTTKKRTRNSFGCVDVGKSCRGNSGNCCSGICQGKKPKKGKKDMSTCVAHDASTCQAGDNGEICGGLENVSCTTSAGDSGTCHTTTGNAGYCPSFLSCAACKRDRDCQELFGGGAACLQCGGCAEGTICGHLSPF